MIYLFPILLGLVGGGFLFTDAIVIPTKIHHASLEKAVNADNDWDHLLFVQRWPASACVDGHVTGASVNGDKCSFPPEMAPNSWLMHGIWPTKTGTLGPVNCNKTAKWDVRQVSPIVDQLKEFWSNLESDTTVDSFWEHEWLKHGTCAQSLPSLVGEYNFFNIPLTFQQKNYNFYDALAGQNIVPDSGRNYSHSQFVTALNKVYGSKTEVWCAFSHDTKQHYVVEIRLCLDKSLSLMDCPADGVRMKSVAGTDLCPTTTNLIYAPIKAARLTSHPFAGRRHSRRF